MNYELAKKLKGAGYPQKKSQFYYRLRYHTSEAFDKGVSLGKKGEFGEYRIEYYPYPRYTTADVKWNERDLAHLNETEVAAPTLSELIEACGDIDFELNHNVGEKWTACGDMKKSEGSTPEIAVSELWLKLNEQSYTK